MADIFAESAAGANGCRLDWSLHFDDAANTITVNATHKRFDGSPAPDPQQAQITTQISTGQTLTLDLLTGGAQFDGGAAKMINAGNRVRTNVRLQVSADRAQILTFSTQYLPPAP